MESFILGFYAIWAWLVDVQREIQLEIVGMLRAYAQTGDWSLLVNFIPWGVAFGAAHALTPGHSKTLLAFFVTGSGSNLAPGLRTAATLATTHVSISVLIVLLGLPIVSVSVRDVGQSDLLETLSRGLLGFVGVWLIVSAIRTPGARVSHHGTAFGITAGLIPCPLTLLVMTYATARGVPEAGVAFAGMMLAGVALVLGTVAGLAILTRRGIVVVSRPALGRIAMASRIALGLTGIVLVAVAVATFSS